MRKWIPAVLIAGCYLFSLWVYPGLPDLVSPSWDALFPWIPASEADAAPRAFAAFAIPTLALIVWLAFRAAASLTSVKRFGPTFDLVIALVVGFVVLFHLVTLGTVIGWPGWTARAFTGLIGAGIMVLGNVMPRTRPNWVAGLRTKATVRDPDLWRLTHRYFGAFLMATGLVVVGISLVSAPYALLGAGVGFLLSAILATALGRRRGAVEGERPPIAGLVIVVLLAGGSRVGAQAAPPGPSPAGFVEQAMGCRSCGSGIPWSWSPTCPGEPEPADPLGRYGHARGLAAPGPGELEQEAVTPGVCWPRRRPRLTAPGLIA